MERVILALAGEHAAGRKMVTPKAFGHARVRPRMPALIRPFAEVLVLFSEASPVDRMKPADPPCRCALR